jgi:hypothetical protein
VIFCLALYVPSTFKRDFNVASIAEGEKDGIAKGKEEIVKNMLGKNMDEMLISETAVFPLRKLEN